MVCGSYLALYCTLWLWPLAELFAHHHHPTLKEVLLLKTLLQHVPKVLLQNSTVSFILIQLLLLTQGKFISWTNWSSSASILALLQDLLRDCIIFSVDSLMDSVKDSQDFASDSSIYPPIWVMENSNLSILCSISIDSETNCLSFSLDCGLLITDLFLWGWHWNRNYVCSIV